MTWKRLLRNVLRVAAREVLQQTRKKSRTTQQTKHPQPASKPHPAAPRSGQEDSPGRYGPGATRDATSAEIAKIVTSYAPNIDGDPDPGEVIWTWVPYVENDGRGKDRPVLIIGRITATEVAACYLTSHARDNYVRVGSGPWDRQRRVSYLNPERVLRVTTSGMRREAQQVTAEQFATALAGITAAGTFKN